MSGVWIVVSFNLCVNAQGGGRINQVIIYTCQNGKTVLCFNHAVEAVSRGTTVTPRIVTAGYYSVKGDTCKICDLMIKLERR